jgi:DNA invertase Pin-like site-specific DNA recombinase
METKDVPLNSAIDRTLASVFNQSFTSDTKNCRRPDLMPLIGYARVSTEDQTPLPQSQALKSAGCVEIHEEQASGGNRARPVLARVLERIGKGDTLVVVRIDRLARSLSHLLEVIERLEAKNAFFRSLTDPIDTSSPQGKFTLQVLGAAAEFERALIRERTKAGLASARTKGRVGGNPGLRVRDPAALRKVRLARQDGYMERLNETAQDWVPHVRRLRPNLAWEDVVRIVNGPLPHERQWTQSRLLRAVNAYVRDGFLPPTVLDRAGRRETDDRLPAIVAAIKGADPDITLQAICTRLEAMRERTPRGRTSWQPSSVKMLLERAERLGLLE